MEVHQQSTPRPQNHVRRQRRREAQREPRRPAPRQRERVGTSTARPRRARRARGRAKRLKSAQTLQRWYRGRRAAKTWRADLRRNFDARVQDLERVRAALAAQHVPFAPPEAWRRRSSRASWPSMPARPTRRASRAPVLYIWAVPRTTPRRGRGVIQSAASPRWSAAKM